MIAASVMLWDKAILLNRSDYSGMAEWMQQKNLPRVICIFFSRYKNTTSYLPFKKRPVVSLLEIIDA